MKKEKTEFLNPTKDWVKENSTNREAIVILSERENKNQTGDNNTIVCGNAKVLIDAFYTTIKNCSMLKEVCLVTALVEIKTKGIGSIIELLEEI